MSVCYRHVSEERFAVWPNVSIKSFCVIVRERYLALPVCIVAGVSCTSVLRDDAISGDHDHIHFDAIEDPRRWQKYFRIPVSLHGDRLLGEEGITGDVWRR